MLNNNFIDKDMLNAMFRFNQWEHKIMDHQSDLIHQFINTTTEIDKLFDNEKYKDDPILAQLKKLDIPQRKFHQHRSEQFFIATEVVTEMITHPLLRAFVYSLWADVSFKVGRTDESQLLLNKSNRMLPKDAPPIFKSYLNMQETILSNRIESMTKIGFLEYEKHHLTSVRYKNLLLTCVRLLAHHGLGRLYGKNLEFRPKNP